jgi:hypothetical protein
VLYQLPCFLVLLALHAENHWDGLQEKAGRPVTFASFRLAFNVQYDRVNPCYDAGRDQFI